MVEQMVSSNLGKYGLGKCASIIGSSDNPVVPAKVSTIRDVQNNNKHGLPIESSALHKGEAVPRPPGTGNANHNLVYARRKTDADSDKNRTSQAEDKKQSLESEAKIKGIPANSIATRIRNGENEQSAAVNTPVMEQWNARFVQLQKYLKQCDSSNQEVYLRKLRSLSPDECSKHAVELEKRTIRLTVEEGREIQRVQDLNVLGKSAGNHLLLQPPTPIFKSENFV